MLKIIFLLIDKRGAKIMALRKFVSMISKYINYGISLNINDSKTEKNLKRISASEEFWLTSDTINFPFASNFKKGNVLLLEFGKNIKPELSFIHMGIVINAKGKYLYVLPITTYSVNNPGHRHAYHPLKNNNNYCKEFALMEKSEFSFLDHDSVLKLNDLRTISTKRFIRNIAYIDTHSDFYKNILNLSFSQIYPSLYTEIYNLKTENDDLKNKINKLSKQLVKN